MFLKRICYIRIIFVDFNLVAFKDGSYIFLVSFTVSVNCVDNEVVNDITDLDFICQAVDVLALGFSAVGHFAVRKKT